MKAMRTSPFRKSAKAKRPWGEGPALFPHISFLHRFSSRGVFLLLSLFLLGGVAVGSAAAADLQLFEGRSILALRFSGIPSPEEGFFFSFTTLLFHALLYLTFLFLLGMTAFGVLAVPAFIFLKGVTVGVGVLSFLAGDGFGWGVCALIYTPAAAAFALLFLFFAVRSLVFSSRLAKVSFSTGEDTLNLKTYFRDLLVFLSLAVVTSFAGSLPAALFAVFR